MTIDALVCIAAVYSKLLMCMTYKHHYRSWYHYNGIETCIMAGHNKILMAPVILVKTERT